MIVITTKLKTVPESCAKCPYRGYEDRASKCTVSFEKGYTRFIPYKYIREKKNWCYVKPEWCPLLNTENSEVLADGLCWKKI